MLSRGQLIQLERYEQILGDAEMKDVLETLKQRKFSAKDLGISYRELNHWSTEKLLYESNEFGKKRLFSVIEIVWIEILKELRLYNFPLKAIKELKENLEITYKVDDFPPEFKDYAIEAMKVRIGDGVEEEFYEELLKSDEFKEVLASLKLNMFENLIFDVYYLKLNYRLLVAYDGNYGFYGDIHHNELTNAVNESDALSRSHISISLGLIIAKIFIDFKVYDLKTKWMLIDEKEEKVLSMLRSPWEIKCITIRFNDKSEMDLIERTQVLKVRPEDYLKRIMIAGGYERIEVITSNGDIVYCEKTTKEKL